MVTQTENLYLGAFLTLEGASLRGVRVTRSNGKPTAIFELESPRAEELASRFFSGTAIVNLQAYREHLEALKDELFSLLRENESERRTDDAHPPARSRAHARR